MFTIDPASGATDRLVIEGALGLGESVVSGSVSPDHFVVDKTSFAVVGRELQHQGVTIVADPGGGTFTRALTAEEEAQPVLADTEAVALAHIGVRIEEHYGAAQDTEWAIDEDGAIWMLQSRPITASGEPEQPGEPAGGASKRNGARPRPRRRTRSRKRARTSSRLARRRRCALSWRCARHPHDRPRLGAAHAASGGDRDRLGRDHLPRSDRLARARGPVRGGDTGGQPRFLPTASWSPSTRPVGSSSRA